MADMLHRVGFAIVTSKWWAVETPWHLVRSISSKKYDQAAFLSTWLMASKAAL